MRSRTDSTSPSTPTLDSIFAPAYLAHLAEQDEPLTANEAEYAGPWKCEAVLGRPGAVAVLRAWEDLDRGDVPQGVFWHEERERKPQVSDNKWLTRSLDRHR